MAELPRYMRPFWKPDKRDKMGITYKLDAEGLRRRMELCAERCEGITDEALEADIVKKCLSTFDEFMEFEPIWEEE